MEELLNAKKEEHLSFLKELIAADTTTIQHGIGGNEMNGQRIVIEKFKSMGLEVDCFEPDNDKLKKYAEADRGHQYANRPNVVGIYKGTGGGKSLILNGHIDTMPFDHLHMWHHHPLSPTVVDGKLYGRGACDMKAGVASMILALETLINAGVELKGDVIIQSVVDEEGGGNGTLSCIDRGYTADAAIVTEPTSLDIMPSHMGWLFYKVEFSGKSTHSALKWKGVNAIEKAMKVMQALQEYERRVAIEKRHPLLPPPTINIGSIHGGMAGSVVPDYCILDFGLHYLPEDSDDNGLGTLLEKEILEVIENVIAGDPWLRENPPVVTKYQEGSGFEIDPNTPIIHILEKNTTNVTGKKAAILGCAYGSDARLLNNYGKTPTVIFGAGDIVHAHGINEFVKIDEYYQAIKILANVIEEWCNSID